MAQKLYCTASTARTPEHGIYRVNQNHFLTNHTPIARLFQSSGMPNTTWNLSPNYSRHC
ncbi:hypothetical protein SCLCIDRAFT_1222545 [Scleroderma citrinum Foug A]|uniref:Uncharacterized protein n=1 Tax=Scleroderma citrinum Foug A TaxID=1036808 RepID=A0A0C3DBH0_9AGAM|nr:hypothetical protein SCLCIDRAFT_1222545 [Scleroderma citrinum Foug A]